MTAMSVKDLTLDRALRLDQRQKPHCLSFAAETQDSHKAQSCTMKGDPYNV
jgi:hypothetical protein